MINIQLSIKDVHDGYVVLTSVWPDSMTTEHEARVAQEILPMVEKLIKAHYKHKSSEGFNDATPDKS